MFPGFDSFDWKTLISSLKFRVFFCVHLSLKRLSRDSELRRAKSRPINVLHSKENYNL